MLLTPQPIKTSNTMGDKVKIKKCFNKLDLVDLTVDLTVEWVLGLLRNY